jgi:hypothetical protein
MFQPRKVERAGLTDRRVPIYIYKGEPLDDVERHYPVATVFLRAFAPA